MITSKGVASDLILKIVMAFDKYRIANMACSNSLETCRKDVCYHTIKIETLKIKS